MLNLIIEEIIKTGMSEYEIASAVTTSQPTINRIRNKKQNTSYELGQRIISLHKEKCISEVSTN